MGKAHAKALTFEERKEIEKYVKLGCSCNEIAINIGRSKNAVVVEVRRNGKAAYSAKAGQKLADENTRKRNAHLIALNTGVKEPIFKYKERIENLEMQIEILHDTLKELLNKW